MRFVLPSQFYQPEQPPSRLAQNGQLMVLAGALALLALWQMTGLPGAQLRRYDPPADMPWSGRGLDQVYIDADGVWTIQRKGYADRMQRYVLTPAGALGRFKLPNLNAAFTDVSGAVHGGTPMLSWGAKLRVRGSGAYNQWTRRMRSSERPAARVRLGDLPSYVALADQLMQSTDSVVPIDIYPGRAATPQDSKRTVEVLPGQHYFPVFDSWAVSEPQLWLTTDRLKRLHRFEITPRGEDAAVALQQSVPLPPAIRPERSAVLGRDPLSRRLFILLATGQRFWFDADSLQALDSETLPGVWEFEYGELGFTGKGYNLYLGWPLTETAYKGIQGALMVVFLASLLALTLLWRHAWKSTAAATTAATNSSSRSSTT